MGKPQDFEINFSFSRYFIKFLIKKLKFSNFLIKNNKKALKITFNNLFAALQKIRNHLIIVGFVIIVYAFIGVFFFKGKLESRCRVTPFPVNGSWPIDPHITRLCGRTDQCPLGYFLLIFYHFLLIFYILSFLLLFNNF